MIHLIIVLIVAGVLMYLFNLLVPMDGRFKTAVNVLIGLVIFLYILSIFGVIPEWKLPIHR